MLNRVIRFAWRVFTRSPFYTLLNILGLALGIAVAVLLLLYLQSDLTYDKHYPDHERIYRMGSRFIIGEKEDNFAGCGYGFGPMITEEFPEVEDFVRLGPVGEHVLMRVGEQVFYENNFLFADSSYFRFFPLRFLAGDPRTCLNRPGVVVLTESTARKFFGDQPALGRVIRTNRNEYEVSAVVEDVPDNSHVKFHGLFPAFVLDPQGEDRIYSLWSANTHTYFLFSPDSGPEEFMARFPGFYNKYMRNIGKNIGGSFSPILERLDRIHFESTLMYDMPRGNRTYLYAFAAIGLLILSLACINYMNMATARSAKRAREIGVRKVLGSTRRELLVQFMGESVLLAFVSLFVALVSVEMLLNLTSFNTLVQKNLELDFLHNPVLLAGVILIPLLVGLVSGVYPAFYLAAISPVSAIKGTYKAGRRGLWLRKALVGFQFTMSLTVVAVALSMLHQLDYISSKNLGFNKEDVVLVPIQDSVVASRIPVVKEALLKYPEVVGVTVANSVPGSTVGRALISVESEKGAMENQVFNIMMVGDSYLETMQIDLVSGRGFRTDQPGDRERAYLVNQAAVEAMGWTNPIGKRVQVGHDPDGNPLSEGTVVGVTQDFNSHSLHNPVDPLLMDLQDHISGYLHVRFNSQMLTSGMQVLQEEMEKADPDRPFEYSFLDKDLQALYQDDRRQARLISILTYLTILISGLGLLGLSSYSTELRFKEIGVRKVLGASAHQIIFLLFREVFVLVLLASLLAAPMAYLLVVRWLENFAFTAPVSPFNFVYTGIGALAAAYVLVYFHSSRAARANPVGALKYE